jgi:hypothetical protein
VRVLERRSYASLALLLYPTGTCLARSPFIYLRNLKHSSQTFPVTLDVYSRLKWLPGLLSHGFALPRLAVLVRCSSILEGNLLFWQLRGVEERLVNHLLRPKNTSDRLVVGILGQLEEEGIEDGGLRFLIGLSLLAGSHT